MAQPAWIKKYLRMKPEVENIFNTLDEYRDFCVRQGYFFDESDLGNERSPYGDYMRTKRGKWPRDNWGWAIKKGRYA